MKPLVTLSQILGIDPRLGHFYDTVHFGYCIDFNLDF